MSAPDFRSEVERRAWDMVKDLDAFHWSDMERAGVVKSTAERYIQRWARHGHLVMVRKDQHRKIWRNAARPMPAPDRPPAERSVQQVLWTLMRRFRRFTPRDLSAHANAVVAVSEDKVRAYCQLLAKTGYLSVRQTAVPGKRDASYVLRGDTGPQAPVSRRVTVLWDPNEETATPVTSIGGQ